MRTSPDRIDRRAPALALLAAAALALFMGCAKTPPGNADLAFRVRVEPDPPLAGPVRLVVDVADIRWRALNGGRVVLTVTPVDGSVPPVVDTAHGEGAGRYVADGFDFATPGDWRIGLRAEFPGALWGEAEHTVTIAR